VFGKCALPNYHGHNYDLIVKVVGVPDENTGYVMAMKVLSELIKMEIVERFDHRNLNLDTQEFKKLNPTAENIALVCWRLLRARLDSKYNLIIKIWETENNVVECDGEA
jgi:6-pyruvoyltetrahydropterin/6-carboxytetrahydropterin synthase